MIYDFTYNLHFNMSKPICSISNLSSNTTLLTINKSTPKLHWIKNSVTNDFSDKTHCSTVSSHCLGMKRRPMDSNTISRNSLLISQIDRKNLDAFETSLRKNTNPKSKLLTVDDDAIDTWVDEEVDESKEAKASLIKFTKINPKLIEKKVARYIKVRGDLNKKAEKCGCNCTKDPNLPCCTKAKEWIRIMLEKNGAKFNYEKSKKQYEVKHIL